MFILHYVVCLFKYPCKKHWKASISSHPTLNIHHIIVIKCKSIKGTVFKKELYYKGTVFKRELYYKGTVFKRELYYNY